jgi:hypothetical protein
MVKRMDLSKKYIPTIVIMVVVEMFTHLIPFTNGTGKILARFGYLKKELPLRLPQKISQFMIVLYEYMKTINWNNGTVRYSSMIKKPTSTRSRWIITG